MILHKLRRNVATLWFPTRFLNGFTLRSLSTVPQLPLSPLHISHFLFGANTDVGKTLVATGLVQASLRRLDRNKKVHYIKPLQCGGSDEDFVRRHVIDNCDSSRLTTHTLFAWDTPTSPHTASLVEEKPCSDQQILQLLYNKLAALSDTDSVTALATLSSPLTTMTYIETAGGVLSPAAASPDNRSASHTLTKHQPSSQWGWKTQADLYQPMVGLSPVVLVGDGRLGGISCTLSALESLVIRGYNVVAIVVIATEGHNDNLSTIREYVTRPGYQLRNGNGEITFGMPSQSLLSLPPIPNDLSISLDEWFATAYVQEVFERLEDFLITSRKDHVLDLRGTIHNGDGRSNAVWWPDTMSDLDRPVYVNSAVGNTLHVVSQQTKNELDRTSIPTLVQHTLWDASASWGTQGVGHGDVSIALSAAAAAGRYGHVSGNIIHEPAIALAQALVRGYSLDRVLFTDNASFAVEAALKMGLRTYQKRMGMSSGQVNTTEWIVATQEDCFHGDTLGAACVAEEYLDREHPWYQSKGFCLEPPTIGFRDGILAITLPQGMEPAPDVKYEFDSIRNVLDVEARSLGKLKSLYKEMIEMQWLVREHSSKQKIGSVLLEPVMLSTGGMKFVDPLWQRALVELAKDRYNIPVIFDESNTGLYRLGVARCRDILKIDPDIAITSTILAGGVVPLSATIVTEEVFEAVTQGEISQSLVNGNTFVANAVSCVCALHSLEIYKRHFDGLDGNSVPHLQFEEEQIRVLSLHPCVEQSFTLGSVVSITLKSSDRTDDDTTETESDQGLSRADQIATHLMSEGVLTRAIGDVLYIMTSPLTSKDECTRIMAKVCESIAKLS